MHRCCYTYQQSWAFRSSKVDAFEKGGSFFVVMFIGKPLLFRTDENYPHFITIFYLLRNAVFIAFDVGVLQGEMWIKNAYEKVLKQLKLFPSVCFDIQRAELATIEEGRRGGAKLNRIFLRLWDEVTC